MTTRGGSGERRFIVHREVDVGISAVQILPENPSRAALILQETGGQVVRFLNADDVSPTWGMQLRASTTLQLHGVMCPSDALWAIRQNSVDGKIVATEVLF